MRRGGAVSAVRAGEGVSWWVAGGVARFVDRGSADDALQPEGRGGEGVVGPLAWQLASDGVCGVGAVAWLRGERGGYGGAGGVGAAECAGEAQRESVSA